MSEIGYLGSPIFQGIDAQGVPIAGGLLWCYAAGADYEKDMYGTIADAINVLNPLPNPMTLNSAGRASIVYAGPSKFVLESNDIDPNTGHGTVIWTADDVGTFGNTVLDPQGNIIVDYGSVDDAANYLKFSNAAIGDRPIIDFTGTDTNVGGLMRFKGSAYSLRLQTDLGGYQFPTGDGPAGYVISTDGAGILGWSVNAGGGGGGIVAPGLVMDYAGTGSPAGGWLLCDGSAVSRATYADLFTAIGTTWGVGDGTNTFNLPNAERRVRVGAGGTGTATLGNAVGNVGGTETVTLTIAQIPSHDHQYACARSAGKTSDFAGTAIYYTGPTTGFQSGATGGGGAHNNLQPSAIYRQFIKT